MRELFIFVSSAQARIARFILTTSGWRHPKIGAYCLVMPLRNLPDMIRGLQFERVCVDSAVGKTWREQWSRSRSEIQAYCTRNEKCVWIEG